MDETGAKSFTGSYGRLLNSPTLMAVPLLRSAKVSPSGQAERTWFAATTHPAPGWLSTTRRCPSLSPSFSATMRAVTSATPPAANGRTSRGERVGYFACAQAERAAARSPTGGSAARPLANLRRFTTDVDSCALVIVWPPGTRSSYGLLRNLPVRFEGPRRGWQSPGPSQKTFAYAHR